MNHNIPFREALRVWLRVAAYSFGGPAGQIAVMHKIVVEEKRWVSENRFLHALNYVMLLPGPEAQQLAAYLGWLLHKTPGGLTAGLLFILPGFLSILALSVLYAGFRDVTLVEGLFYGLKPAVMAVVVEAVVRIGRRALRNGLLIGLAALSFVAIFFFDVPFPLIVVGAGVIGYVGGLVWEEKFYLGAVKETADHNDNYAISDDMGVGGRPSTRQTARTLLIWLFIWLAPLAGLFLWLGGDHLFSQISLFFSKMAVVTFGGAYAALAYIAQEAVNAQGWLLPGEMLDGLGMAETTPGPLIQVVQFVGFMAAYRHAGMASPMLAGLYGAILTTWMTFVPCFLWIFVGAPYIEYLRGNRRLTTALTGITAAVVGVILNLAVWFSLHVLFGAVDERFVGPLRFYAPQWATVDWTAMALTVAAFVALFRLKWGMLTVLGGSALLGLILFSLAALLQPG
jgi:chromate transporter